MDLLEARQAAAGGFAPRRHPWEVARADVCAHLLTGELGWPANRPVTVLDVGCGDGYLGQSLALRFPQLTIHGIDPELPTAPSPAEAQATGAVESGAAPQPRWQAHRELADTALPTGSVDALLLLDVLEHIEDDGAALRALLAHPSLAPGALVLITVPAFACLFSSQDRRLKHFRRYRLGRLCQVAEGAGLTVMRSGYFFASLLPLRLAEVLLERCRLRRAPETAAVARWRGGRWLTALLVRLLWCDYRCGRGLQKLGVTLPGLSCYLIGQKQGS